MSAALLLLLAIGSLSMAQETSVVFGVVRDAQTRRPIEGARLYLAPYALRLPDPLFPTLRMVPHSFIGFETTTDAAGLYRFSNLPPHRYCLTARKDGYWRTGDEMCQLSMIRTGAGGNLEKDLVLDRAPTLRGRFLDRSTSTPISGLRLVVLQQKYDGGIRQWTASYGMKPGPAAGEFELSPPRGEFYLEILPAGAEKIAAPVEQGVSTAPFYGRGYYPGVTDIANATPIVLAPGEDRFLEIRLPKQQPRSVSVEIAGAPDDAGVQLALERRSAGYFQPTLAKASFHAGDAIQIEGLSEAEYILIAWTNDKPAGRMGAVRRFSTANPDTSHLKLDLEPMLTLQAMVRVDAPSAGAPIGDFHFSMKAEGRENPNGGDAQVKIAPPGAFDVGGLFPGKYHVYAAAPPGWVVSKMQYGTLDAIHQVFTLDRTSRLLITLSPRVGAVTGSLMEGNRPMDNAMVVLAPEPIPEDAYVNSFPWTHLDETGRYEFGNVVPGRYRVIPFYGSTLGFYHDLSALREHARGYREVNVLPGKTRTGVDFVSNR